MKIRLIAVTALLVCSFATLASAADDGNTQPRLSTGGTMFANDFYEIIPTANGTGNVKGVRCVNSIPVLLKIYVNGGTAQTLTIDNSGSPSSDSGWIPMNLRFTTSIRVRMERPSSPTGTESAQCTISWAFD